ncbi:MAG TPA: MFS transporter [Polyangiales bacterium]
MAGSRELRIYVHAFIARLFFYVPVLLHHMEQTLGEAGVRKPRALSLSIIALVSMGNLVAEYPSGLFADWVGRKRSMVFSGVLQALAILLFFLPSSVWSLCAAQLLIGAATAFRTGADTALLHAHLEDIGQAHRYGTALARLRFFNVLAIAAAAFSGGSLYAWKPASVFWLSSLMSVLGTVALLGLREPAVTVRERSIVAVLKESLAEARKNGHVQALMLLGGVGNTYFVFSYWVTQTYLIDSGASLASMGVTVGSISLLQAFTMPLSAWVSVTPGRVSGLLALVSFGLPLAFLAAALAWMLGQPLLGSWVFVLIGAGHVLFRNAVNLRLQGWVPDTVRASIVSLESLLGSIWYVVFFPLGGLLLSWGGVSRGFAAVAAVVALTLWPLWVLGLRKSGRLPAPPVSHP